ncbi:MAG: hypothetical protein AAFR96_03100 [Planctomycetota bacterium]
MLYQINTSAWLAWAGLLCVSLILGRGVAAQPSPAAPGAIATMDAFERVEPWVRSLAVPDDAAGPDMGGACVTLRLRGRVVGRGTSIGLGEQTLVQAARLAIADALPALIVSSDADAEARALLEARALVVSVELAGAPVPLAEQTYTEISASLSPGLDAVAVGLGSAADAVFPLEMLASGQQAGSAASRLVSSISGDALTGLRQPSDLMADARASFFRLRTSAVSQLRAGGAPKPLVRGGRLVELTDVASRRALERFVDETAAWLASLHDSDVYLPTNDSVIEPASPAGQALRAFALARAIAVRGESVGLDRKSLRAQIEQLNTPDTTSRALANLARSELDMPMLELDPADDRGGPVSRAIAAFALARAGERERAERLLKGLRRVENPAELVGAMPWLGWAEQAAAGEGEIPSAVALREMRRIVTDFQLTAADAGADNLDLVGGIVFTSGTLPLPTWQSARPVAFLASMLSDGRLTTPAEQDAELASLLRSLRFLRQLAASEAEAFIYREPASALGGIRAAVWDQQMPTDASAMTLLALVETLESLDSMARKDRQDGPK